MAIQSRSLTYDDLKQERETRDERLELIEGEIIVTPSPCRDSPLPFFHLSFTKAPPSTSAQAAVMRACRSSR